MNLDIKKTKLLQYITDLKKIYGGYTREKVMFHTSADISNIDAILRDDDIFCDLICYYNKNVNPYIIGSQGFRQYKNSNEGTYAR